MSSKRNVVRVLGTGKSTNKRGALNFSISRGAIVLLLCQPRLIFQDLKNALDTTKLLRKI